MLAAGIFVNKFYHALHSSRQNVATFYAPPATMPNGRALPAILFNGNVLPDAMSFQKMFQEQMPPMRYEIQSYDCQVVNSNFVADGEASDGGASGKNMTILVLVSGYVKIGELRDTPMRGFSETFVLVPKADTRASRGRKKPLKEWLIQSQNFRLVV